MPSLSLYPPSLSSTAFASAKVEGKPSKMKPFAPLSSPSPSFFFPCVVEGREAPAGIDLILFISIWMRSITSSTLAFFPPFTSDAMRAPTTARAEGGEGSASSSPPSTAAGSLLPSFFFFPSFFESATASSAALTDATVSFSSAAFTASATRLSGLITCRRSASPTAFAAVLQPAKGFPTKASASSNSGTSSGFSRSGGGSCVSVSSLPSTFPNATFGLSPCRCPSTSPSPPSPPSPPPLFPPLARTCTCLCYCLRTGVRLDRHSRAGRLLLCTGRG
mmetsp:Transcript_20974/g.54176  ORF Transcript_20974/g.54176 Transcript_20974/m.54176 type:complete len:277 (-) Transcript_20974:1263-2093(-)